MWRSPGTLILAVCGALTLFPVGAQEIPTDSEVQSAVKAACDLLMANQERYQPDRPVGRLDDAKLVEWQDEEKARLAGLRKKSGSKALEWPYEGVYRLRRDGRIPPGYRVGGSAIACEALLEAPGLDSQRRKAINRSIVFMLEMIASDPGMAPKKQTNYDVRGWGQAYALKFFLRALQLDFIKNKKLRKQVENSIPHLISCLSEGQVDGGGWNYAGRGVSPFMTGSTLIALFRAQSMEYEVDPGMVTAALDALERGRGDNNAYAYSGKVRRDAEPMEGACARSAVAELCLFRAGRSDLERLRVAVDGFFEEKNWKELLKRKSQQGTHVPPFGVAPYYFFYGHTYAALAVEHLPEEERVQYRQKMRELLWRTIDPNGGWNDRIFPRTESYSTAMAVLSLVAPKLPEVPAWGAVKESRL